MANNIALSCRIQTRRSAGGNSPQLRKGSKNKGSRVSISSEVSDSEISVFESCDDAVPFNTRTELYTPKRDCAASENDVKSIDNSHPGYHVKKPKPKFHCSVTFQQVMLDMYGETDYGSRPYTVPKQKGGHISRTSSRETPLFSSAVEERRMATKKEIATNVKEEKNTSLKLKPTPAFQWSANRDRRMRNRRVNESAFEYQTQAQRLDWGMLLHTIKQTSSIQTTRKDLYERYGIVPTTLPDGTVVCENLMISDRARAQLYGQTVDGHRYRRPISHLPPSLQLRSVAKTGYSNLSRHSCDFVRITNTCYQTKRPKTAK